MLRKKVNDCSMQFKALFGRAPAPAPKPAPAGALPNGLKWSSSSHGAAPGAPSGFHWGGGATKTWLQAAPTILHPNSTGEVVLPNVFINGFNFTREVAPPEKPEPELFLEEPEPCQTGPNYFAAYFSNQDKDNAVLKLKYAIS